MVIRVSLDTLIRDLESGRRYRERRHEQWTMNYTLYRDTVTLNRLTQRQSVNVPYMKETCKTYLSQTDTPPDLYFTEKGNDTQKELYLNEYWADTMDRLKVDILDEIDRKQEWLYGRSYMKLNILDGQFHMEVIDPQDVIIGRYTNPWDIDSARFITHVGIYRTLSDLKLNPLYDEEAIKELERFFATKAGLIVAGQNAKIVADRSKRLQEMGVPDVMLPILGETYVEINEHQRKVWDEERQEDVIWVCVSATGNQILMEKPLEEILGVNTYTWCSWAGDAERTDWFSDGGADSVRQLNLVANARWSQKVENGTLLNFGMQFYDSTANQEWAPGGYEPSPFGFYPVPGDPSKIIKRVEVEEMGDAFQEQAWIKERIEGVSGANAVTKGEDAGPGKQTLGEIQMLAAAAQKRAAASSKYHKRYWEDIGNKFCLIVMANAKSMTPVDLYKKNGKGKIYKKTLDLNSLVSKEGYKVRVSSKADKESEALQSIQKYKIVAAEFPNNVPLRKIYEKKLLDWSGLSADEQKEVMDFEEQNGLLMMSAAPANGAMPSAQTPPQRPPMPAMPAMANMNA